MTSGLTNKALRIAQFPIERESKICKCFKCPNTTRGDKDYCVTHVLENPYAKRLIAELDNRKREDAQVGMQGSTVVNMEGITSKEILLAIKFGPCTIERIAKNLNLDRTIIYYYAVALKKVDKIQFSTSRRGALVLHLRETPAASICA